MSGQSRYALFLVAALSFALGLLAHTALDHPPVQAQQTATSGMPSAIQTNAKVFLQMPESIAGSAYTVREVNGPWVLVDVASGGQLAFQRYWVYGPNLAWGVEGAFQPVQR